MNEGVLFSRATKELGNSNELFGDAALATTVLDRLLHHSYIANIRGQSYRIKDKMKAGVYTSPIEKLTTS